MSGTDEAQYFWALQDMALVAAQAATDQHERQKQIDLAEHYAEQAARLEARLPRPDRGPILPL